MKKAQPQSWKDYFERTKGKPPRPLLVKAIGLLKEKGNALDLGSGALNDSAFLLSQGFSHVTAVDKVPVAIEIAKQFPKEKFEYVISSFEDYLKGLTIISFNEEERDKETAAGEMKHWHVFHFIVKK